MYMYNKTENSENETCPWQIIIREKRPQKIYSKGHFLNASLQS